MKNLLQKVCLLLVLVPCLACGDTDESSKDSVGKGSVIGSWKLVEAYISAGGPQYWVTIPDGEEFTFSNKGSFTSSKFSECTGGTFSIQSEELHLDYNCGAITRHLENEAGMITYQMEFEAGYMLLTPLSVVCIEGCTYKFKKMHKNNSSN